MELFLGNVVINVISLFWPVIAAMMLFVTVSSDGARNRKPRLLGRLARTFLSAIFTVCAVISIGRILARLGDATIPDHQLRIFELLLLPVFACVWIILMNTEKDT